MQNRAQQLTVHQVYMPPPELGMHFQGNTIRGQSLEKGSTISP